ncbi:MAG: RIP metalloprotease RseP [gamma proteobacterium symbiont of Bathyaustriella thionipta]|nr:RIP metalloprotease RseP [gamma proteobacterium symbiont of Bathyaustriella thionipta]MCU7948580.1 RIP metalloprotease RseP [gamma proteobacterium symbiont of Bathyaustriella thionipta]MCU7953299.1 RIP metalloprotease RseP [gamma proteobacterium symbiont of Bathyaustriella thionipta]MCU7955086.1 RIP metalloprotease RseP [gamma proteobacterium symbiont of Bathyaustriella thionipta]MCU7967018.1 RIP metalloprotease RseP [gamma proteobacterium symbiont of Bathyaustriella thionipta]
MDNMIVVILAFIFTIALLVAIHEYGHFWVARKLNVKVLRFSIGFGTPLFRFRGVKDNTEFVLASIPLGGYVKMLDEREGDVAEEESHRAFNRQSVYKRFAIVFAGPFVNFVFAVFAFWLMFVIGIQGIKPVMGHLDTNSIAWQSGLRSGDQIVSVDGDETPTLNAVYEQLLEAFIERKNVILTLSDQRNITFRFDGLKQNIEPSELQDIIGLSLQLPVEKVIISEVTADSPAATAGMLSGDQIVSINGLPIDHWRDLVRSVIDKPGKKIVIELLRNGQHIQLPVTIGTVKKGSKTIGQIGVRPKSVTPLPESMYAMHQYDVITAITKGIEKTWDLSVLTLKMLGRIVVGEASIKNISGPITIAEVAGHSVQMGFENFLRFLAIVSLSLGVINLLPIPMLDGGHLLFYLVEMVKGSPVSDAVQEIGLKIGITLLVMLMSIALYNDFTRLLN